MTTSINFKTIFQNERLQSFVFWSALLIALDQFVKAYVFANLKQAVYLCSPDQPLIGLQLFLNDKFAFSLPVPVVIMYGVYAVILIVLVRFIATHSNAFTRMQVVSWLLIIAGALSNVFERALQGYVKDFIYIVGGGVLNVADFYILIGIALLLWSELQEKFRKI